MSKQPAISVCMPVYNAEKYLTEAVESILRQSFGDFEFLIIDDGSQDSSPEILRRFAGRDARIRLTSRPNKGLAATLNELVDQARGEWIARMDADDIALPERFERQVEYLRSHPECVVVGTAAQVIDPDGDPICVWHRETEHDLLDAHNLLGNRGTSLCHPSVMMRRSEVLAVGKYSERFRIGEDLDIFLKLAERGRLANLPEALLRYRTHGTNFTRTRSDDAYRDLERIVSDARERRGLPAEPWTDAAHALTAPQPAKNQEVWGWQALQAGNVATARKHAKKLLKLAPLSGGSWRLLYCALRGR